MTYSLNILIFNLVHFYIFYVYSGFKFCFLLILNKQNWSYNILKYIVFCYIPLLEFYKKEISKHTFAVSDIIFLWNKNSVNGSHSFWICFTKICMPWWRNRKSVNGLHKKVGSGYVFSEICITELWTKNLGGLPRAWASSDTNDRHCGIR